MTLIMQDNKFSHFHSRSPKGTHNSDVDLQYGIWLGWAVLVFIVILVAAALSRIITRDIAADETLLTQVTVEERQQTSSDALDAQLLSDPIHFSDTWIRATPPGAITAAAYLVIENSGPDDRLLHIHSDHAAKVEIHTTREQSGVMRMSRMESLLIPAQEKVTLSPGGDHIMFFDLHDAFAAGSTETLTLYFEKAGIREISFTVRDPRSENK